MVNMLDIYNLSIVEAFKHLYPESKLEEEVNPYSGIKLFKTYSVFSPQEPSNKPQLYLLDDPDNFRVFYDYESGWKGNIADLLVKKFNDVISYFPNYVEGHVDYSPKSLDYVAKRLNVKDQDALKESFYDVLHNQEVELAYDVIWGNSLLNLNQAHDEKGNWTCPETGKWEEWNDENKKFIGSR